MAESNVWETRLVAASLVDKIYDNHLLILDSFLSIFTKFCRGITYIGYKQKTSKLRLIL